MQYKIGNDWDEILAGEFSSAYFLQLWESVQQAYTERTVYPAQENIFRALRLTPYGAVRVVILGQDPYHTPGAADGLAFSVPRGVRVPPSLCNIFTEIERDIGKPVPNHGCLEDWARRGILLLNSILTVEAGRPRSHAGIGWEQFTDAVLAKLNDRPNPIAFLLWGSTAQKKRALITAPRHMVLTAAHPSPLAGGRFFGCGHFSKVNEMFRTK